MNNQHLDFIPGQDDNDALNLFTDISPEDIEKANEVLKDCPEPDYSTMVPPLEEACSFIMDDDEDDDCPTFTSDEGFFIMDDGDVPPPSPGIDAEISEEDTREMKAARALFQYEGSVITAKDVAAMFKEHPEWMQQNECGEWEITAGLDSAIRELVIKRTEKKPSRHHVSSYELEQEYGPMDDDEEVVMRMIYEGSDDEEEDDGEDDGFSPADIDDLPF